jgi:hypothetical protein
MIQMAITLKNPTGPASEAAFAFALKLTKQATEGQPAVRVKLLGQLATMNAQQISDVINLLKGQPKPAAPAPAKQPVPGHYVIDGVKYEVKISKATKWAYLIKNGVYLGAKGEAAGILADIAENGQTYAIAYAKVTGKCGVCNTKLTDPKSIAAGIGPVCAKKF